MTTPYDKTTEKLAEQYALNSSGCPPHGNRTKPAWHYGINDFTAGRNSAKESLIIAVRALEKYETQSCSVMTIDMAAKEALAQIRASGNMPIEEG